MKTYTGERTARGVVVTVDGQPLRDPSDPHDPIGFEWGYDGPEPLNLSRALLEDCVGRSVDQSQIADFLAHIVRGLDNWWTLSEDDVRSVARQ